LFGAAAPEDMDQRSPLRRRHALIVETRAGEQVVLELLAVLDGFDAEEAERAEHRHYQEADQRSALPKLRGSHAQRHRKAAEQQDERVDSPQYLVKVMMRVRELRRIKRPIERQAHKERAEEHDLRHQKGPHPDDVGLILLRHIHKLQAEMFFLAVSS